MRIVRGERLGGWDYGLVDQHIYCCCGKGRTMSMSCVANENSWVSVWIC